ncbi:crossover junction endonuclease MUS81-like isoform X1 [Biomphalaria glabrata]|uniref:Crossover junction endonuclease MUS81 n=1 Tax=Biomphalaria glabrata TaxID=6526 RepID=A0A9W2ZZW2_BIOGL|nr:crossover junction endonuclease MUS81-like isoform X1 [Biomphalaria glabrata]
MTTAQNSVINAFGQGMQKKSLKGKRKKKVPKNANPLFTQWLTEWKIEAEEKGWKSAHTYGKALKSLKMFPLTLETGKDCRILQNFGEKICNMLDEKLLDYKKQNGISSISSIQLAINLDKDETAFGGNKVKEKISKTHSRKKENTDTRFNQPTHLEPQEFTSLHQERLSLKDSHASSSRVLTRVHEISDNSDSDHDAPPLKKTNHRSSSEGRVYIPAYRSGPYALVLTLYRHMQCPKFKGYMLKAELVQAAQPLCDKSFTKPDPGSRYTAWSSASSLIRKGFMSKVSSPAKYSLTEAGIKLAQQLEEAENKLVQRFDDSREDTSLASNCCQSTRTTHSVTKVSSNTPDFGYADAYKADLEDEILISSDTEMNQSFAMANYHQFSPMSKPAHSISPLPSPEKNVDLPVISTVSEIREPNSIQQNVISVELIKSPKDFLNCDIVELSEDSDSGGPARPSFEKAVVKKKHFSDDDDLPDLDIPLSKRLLMAGGVKSELLNNHVAKIDEVVSAKDPVSSSYVSIKCPKKTHEENVRSKDSCEVSSKETSYKSSTHIEKKILTKSVSAANLTSENQRPLVKACPLTYFPRKPEQQVSTKQIGPVTTSQITPLFTLEPHTFEIILCLDNREFYGRTNSKTLLPDLIKSGIHCDLRLLHVGDILWIAREIVPPQIDRVEARELVLNHIIERKRLDDLVKSIVEGRMKDQKCRLKFCGIKEAIILVEEYGSIQNFSISEERIKQSIVNSQIIDGFKVKMCSGPEAVATYISTMTRFLQQHLSSKRLHAVLLDQIRFVKDQQNIMNQNHYLLPFNIFNENSVKQKDLTVKEMFMKQLFQIPGISADRAKAITRVYPTLSFLMEAFENCKDAKEKEKLLSGIKTGKSERNLGISLSRLVSLLYTQTSSLS